MVDPMVVMDDWRVAWLVVMKEVVMVVVMVDLLVLLPVAQSNVQRIVTVFLVVGEVMAIHCW